MTDDQLLRVADVMALLNIKRRTVYTIPYLRRKVVYPTPRSPRWWLSDIRLYLAQRQGLR